MAFDSNAGSIARPGRRLRRRSQLRRAARRRPYQLNLRALWIWGGLVLVAIALAARLAHLQLIQGPELRQRAVQQQLQISPLPVARSPIIDSQGSLLAVDRIVYTLYGHPALFQQPPGVVAETLSPLLDQPAAALSQQFRQQNTGLRIADDLSVEIARRIRQLRLDGLELIPQQQRFYPQADLFGPLVGFVNLEGQAGGGLELSQAERLTLPEVQTTPVPGPALPVGNVRLDAPAQLQLTLDSRLQRVAQAALEDTLATFGAEKGTVMVMDVQTGALHALAVAPSFDPNRYFEAPLDRLKNWAVNDLYEPGSTLKPVNVAIALESGAIQPNDTIYDEGQIRIGEWTIENADYEYSQRQGTLNITQVLQYSSNVGMVHIMEKLKAADFYGWLEKLGFGEPTGIDLPGEAAAAIKDRDQFINSRVDAATAAFGQGVVVTPIKLLQLQAAIANGGKLVTPHVIKGLVDSEGTLQWQPLRPAPTQVFSPETSASVLAMMEAVVSNGTGKTAQVAGYRIGGKTGTAQKVTAAGYYGPGRITSFVGIVPVEAPRFVVLAVIDGPQGEDAYGSTVAAPLVKEVMESLVVLEGIPPSSPQALGGIWVLPGTRTEADGN
jgi:cell division protein FtsI (penicillin-binding protein 3)